MCGFLVYERTGDNARVQRRGPDATQVLQISGLTFVHNLLSTTGDFTPQPFVEDEVVCVYNGQIYNHPFSRSDGEVLIPLYRRHGTTFARHLDGEFALALYDFRERIAVFATDPFKTKPLFINGIECASYRSGVGGEKARPNEILVKSFNGTVLDRASVRSWDLLQWHDDYDGWIRAFEHAVRKRAKAGCFIGLSSGYDSGGIACALRALNVEFKAYVFAGNENHDVLDARRRLVAHEDFALDAGLAGWLEAHMDNEAYTIRYNGETTSMRVLDDSATLGTATLASLASAEGRKVLLSGQGADEIMTDYSPWPAQSELKGTFPARQAPWTSRN